MGSGGGGGEVLTHSAVGSSRYFAIRILGSSTGSSRCCATHTTRFSLPTKMLVCESLPSASSVHLAGRCCTAHAACLSRLQHECNWVAQLARVQCLAVEGARAASRRTVGCCCFGGNNSDQTQPTVVEICCFLSENCWEDTRTQVVPRQWRVDKHLRTGHTIPKAHHYRHSSSEEEEWPGWEGVVGGWVREGRRSTS